MSFFSSVLNAEVTKMCIWGIVDWSAAASNGCTGCVPVTSLYTLHCRENLHFM
jgi:hypothetical protein